MVITPQKYNLLSTEKYGFRIGLKVNAIYKLTTEISNALNNKLLVGGILCDLEELFDCIDYGILFSKLKVSGIRARILYFINFTCTTGMLEQQYVMTAISVIQFKLGNFRHGVRQGSSFLL